ncbi:MAG: hypothetical protein JSW07_23270 [bacterium]|nr:MAG: hypothetical protein JSW07_23270 [bacterium]
MSKSKKTTYLKVKLLKSIRIKSDTAFTFKFSRTHYVIPAWYANQHALMRILRLRYDHNGIYLAEIVADNELETTSLTVNIYGKGDINKEDLNQLRKVLVKSLRLESTPKRVNQARKRKDITEIIKNDPVVRTAYEYNGINVKGKLYPSLFEALCGIICAQRMVFARIPKMMGKMAEKTAPSIVFNGYLYPAFPYAHEIVAKGENTLRECGLGYRASRVIKMAKAWEQNNLEQRGNPKTITMEKLMELPGIGPYTANLALTLTGRNESKNVHQKSNPHIDSYVRMLIGHLYFDGNVKSEEDTLKFMKSRWGWHAETIISCLTTDSHEWATQLGFKLPVKSGARALYLPKRYRK